MQCVFLDDPECLERERLLNSQNLRSLKINPWKRFFQRVGRVLQFGYNVIIIFSWRLGQKKIYFLPDYVGKKIIVYEKIREKSSVALATHDFKIPTPLFKKMRSKQQRSLDNAFAEQLCDGIFEGLQKCGVELLEDDQKSLVRDMQNEIEHIRQVEAEIALIRPHKIIGINGRAYPGIDYALIAKREGIPTMSWQHGLDGAPYINEDFNTTEVAVWSQSRIDRYEMNAGKRETKFKVCGNPFYQNMKHPDRIVSEGEYWLWLPQARTLDRCYLPSMSPETGLQILDVLLKALEKSKEIYLVIKPHPAGEYENSFKELIESSSAKDRVSINKKETAQSLLPKASLVLTENSTAGLDAMFWGKILVYIHFDSSEPYMAYGTDGAALPAYSVKMLNEVLEGYAKLDAEKLKEMAIRQKEFLDKYAGPLEGNAIECIKDLILEN